MCSLTSAVLARCFSRTLKRNDRVTPRTFVLSVLKLSRSGGPGHGSVPNEAPTSIILPASDRRVDGRGDGGIGSEENATATSGRSVVFANRTPFVPYKSVDPHQWQPGSIFGSADVVGFGPAVVAASGSTGSDGSPPVSLAALGVKGREQQQRKATLVVPPLPTPTKVVWKSGLGTTAAAATLGGRSGVRREGFKEVKEGGRGW